MCPTDWPLHSHTGQQVQWLWWDSSSVWPLWSFYFTEIDHVKWHLDGKPASHYLPCGKQHTSWEGVSKEFMSSRLTQPKMNWLNSKSLLQKSFLPFSWWTEVLHSDCMRGCPLKWHRCSTFLQLSKRSWY